MLTNGDSYLFASGSGRDIKELIAKLIKNYPRGLIISRETRQKILADESKKNIKNIWLTDITTEADHINPKEIEQLCYDVEKYIGEGGNGFIILTGIEYLISYTSFKEVFHLINRIKDITAMCNIVFIVCVGNKTMKEEEDNMLRQELLLYGDIDGKN